MLQLRDRTPFRSAIATGFGRDGGDVLLVAIKGTFVLGSRLTLAEEQLPIHRADVYRGEPGRSSLLTAADLCLGKPATDVILSGCAHSKDSRPVTQLDVTLGVAGRMKRLRVFGDRMWTGATFGSALSSPIPFHAMPLVYERAFGGDGMDPLSRYEPRNPVGLAFSAARPDGPLKGRPLPNVETPWELLSAPGQQVTPAGFAPVASFFMPRRGYAGTYDAAWQQTRAPFLPEDFDLRFFQVAPADQIQPGYLRGGEPIHLDNLHPAGPLDFNLPTCEFEVAINVAGRSERLLPTLGTVHLEPDRQCVSLTWLASLRCDKELLRVEEVTLQLNRLGLAAA